jgi:hypothetical protein
MQALMSKERSARFRSTRVRKGMQREKEKGYCVCKPQQVTARDVVAAVIGTHSLANSADPLSGAREIGGAQPTHIFYERTHNGHAVGAQTGF